MVSRLGRDPIEKAAPDNSTFRIWPLACRLDDMVIFHPLDGSHMEGIAKLQLEDVISRMKAKGVHLAVDASAAALVARTAFDPLYGARPLRRWIERHIVTELSRMVLAGS